MLQKLYRLCLRLRGYRPEWRHPLEVHKPRPGRDPEEIKRRIHKQAILQQHIHRHAEVERQRRALKMPVPEKHRDYRAGSMDPLRRLESEIEECFLAVDRVFYRAGL